MFAAINNQASDFLKKTTLGVGGKRKTNLKNVNRNLMTCECHKDSTKTVRTPERQLGVTLMP